MSLSNPVLTKTAELTLRASLARPDFNFDVNLTIGVHGVTALFGASGSGKTTCLRIVAGLEAKAQGRVALGSVVWQDSSKKYLLHLINGRLVMCSRKPVCLNILMCRGT